MSARSGGGSAATRTGRTLALGATVLVALTIALYVWIMVDEEDRIARAVPVVVILVVGLLGTIGALRLRSPERRGLAGAGAAGLLLSMGFLGLFSIGLPLLIAGLSMLAWLVRTSVERSLRPDRVILAFIAGLAVPWVLLFA